MNAYERLLLPENLNYAWVKAKNLYRMADGYIDTGEIAAFELDLERRLKDIRRQFEKGSYRLKPLRPLPRPKKICGEQAINRQYYHVAIEDQVAWIALVNALGPNLDQMMEPWSYGNRLYRPAWYEKDEESNSHLEIGPYRHASGHLYRKFQHSWPLFRRHISLTARMMAFHRKLRSDEMDEPDQLAEITAERTELIYFKPEFWVQKKKSSKTDLYYASIDLKQFFPDLKVEGVLRGLTMVGGMAEPQIANIVTKMLDFQIDTSGMPDAAFENVEPPFLKTSVKGIPTGLFVAGFLANAAMFPIDRLVATQLAQQRNVAHFRFVDDHTIIAYDFDVLCNWILWYERLLKTQDIGPKINEEKYDPENLGSWLSHLKSGASIADSQDKKGGDLRASAMHEAKLDGKNPTKLMTKTLAQVSAIAATDIHILDDGDLGERLKMLEWLLLADIPEREIRPDTRAAFAAGQIASLVPVLIQEANGLVDTARDVAAYELRRPKTGQATADEQKCYEEKLEELKSKLRDCENNQEHSEHAIMDRCFRLLLQSLREHPGKPRLFYRIHQYCRVTGHQGLASVSEWLEDMRVANHHSWADYYIALSFQLMAAGLLTTARRLLANSSLRSDVKASVNYLKDVAGLDIGVYCVPQDRETWYHAMGRREFGVALIQVAQMLWGHSQHVKLAQRLAALSKAYVNVQPGNSADMWLAETGYTPGVWAHLAEEILSANSQPSPAWSALVPSFSFDQWSDLQGARRYPEYIPSAAWTQLLNMSAPLPKNDSAWLYEVINGDPQRCAEAKIARKVAFTQAARAQTSPPTSSMTVNEWTASIRNCSPFDPRRGEWTALEITAQLLEDATSTGGDEAVLDRLHPNNVLLPRAWVDCSPCDHDRTELSWEEWRRNVRNDGKAVRLRDTRTSLSDYRYALSSKIGVPIAASEKRLAAVGRLLFGLLRNDHAAPRIWNLRGNELVVPLPRGRWFEFLAISSWTTQILEACLGARSAESRAITRTPSLFGWHDGDKPNDADFDGPTIFSSTDLLEQIRHAQQILEDNQLAVARNQPRQVIPFRLTDFAAGVENVDIVSEGDPNAQ